jgi:site-specific recombinase XerD
MEKTTDGFYDWLVTGNFDNPYSEHTARAYLRVSIEFDQFCEKESIIDCSEFSIAHVRKFVSTSKTGKVYANSTITARTITLSLIFSWLTENGYCNENPVLLYRDAQFKKRGGKGGRAATRLPSVLSWEEQERLFEASMMDDTLSGYRNSAMIAVFLDVGLRTQELINLSTVAGNDYMAGRMRVIGKGNKERLIRFTPKHADRMKTWMAERTRRSHNGKFENLLFVSDRGGKMSQPLIYMNINKLLKRANVEPKNQMGGHLLRHTSASIMLAEGLSLKEVQENLGHSSIVTTEKYLHLLPQTK